MPPRILSRWIVVIPLVVLLLVLGPTPHRGEIASSIERVKTAASEGKLETVHEEVDELLTLEPALAALHYPASFFALLSDDLADAESHLDMAPPTGEIPFTGRCSRFRIDLNHHPDQIEKLLADRELVSCPGMAILLREATVERLNSPDPEQALPLLQLLAEMPDPAYMDLIRLASLRMLNDPDQAMLDLQSALDLQSGNDELTLDLIGIADSIDPAIDEGTVLGNMGRTFFKHGEYEDAARALGRSLQTRPGESNLRAYYGYALDRLGEDGLEHLLAAVDDNPGEVIPRLLLGMHWREAGEYASALAQFERAASLDPDNPAVAAELGATYFASGDVRSAIAAYRIAANLARNDPGFWLVLAEFSILNQIEVASMGIPAARNALALNSGDVTASSALGYAHLISGDPLLGSRLLRRSIRRDPDHPAVQYYYALSMQLAGDSEAARSAFKRVMGLDQDGAYGQLAARYLREQ